jgi:colicin import membrane protein
MAGFTSLSWKAPTLSFSKPATGMAVNSGFANTTRQPWQDSFQTPVAPTPTPSTKPVEVAGVYKTSTPFANEPTTTPSPVLQDSISIVQQREAEKAAQLVQQQQQLAEQQRQADLLRQQQQQEKEQEILRQAAAAKAEADALETQKQLALAEQKREEELAYQAQQEQFASEAAAAEALKLRDEEAARLAAEKLRLQAEVDTAQLGLNKAGEEAKAAGITSQRISKTVGYRNQQLQNQAQQPAQVVTNVRARNRAEINRPGVSSTKINTGLSIGGYSGTKAGRVNPTGLNI